MTSVQHLPEECIGCASCVAIHPKGWKMTNDGKSAIIGGEPRQDGTQEKKLADKEDEQLHREAANSCPTNAIRIIEP